MKTYSSLCIVCTQPDHLQEPMNCQGPTYPHRHASLSHSDIWGHLPSLQGIS